MLLLVVPRQNRKGSELDAAIEDEDCPGDTESDGQDVAGKDTSESEADGMWKTPRCGRWFRREAAANDGESDELQDELAQREVREMI